MKVTFWGTRGSLASAGPETVRYGGNTACVQVTGSDGTCIVLDAGTGIRRLGAALSRDLTRVDILLTHLHMDHIQGLGFFDPLFRPGLEVHIWGPPSATQDLRTRLSRYLSPPLFPIRLRDADSDVHFHNAPDVPVSIGGLEVCGAEIVHPGPTVGYRVRDGAATFAYLSDHEPALTGDLDRRDGTRWTSGADIAAGVDLLVHDVQYSPDERAERIGWGHSSSLEAAAFARLVGARRLAAFHHDPGHDDAAVDRIVAETAAAVPEIGVFGAREGETVHL
ncbi:MAG: MBL fold metallo-hydrolase [Chloroflexota bacterium]